MEEVQDFLREVARIRRILLRKRLWTIAAWWARVMACVAGAALWAVGSGIAPDRVRLGAGAVALVGIAWMVVDLWWSFRRLKNPYRLGRILRGCLPGIRRAVETLSQVDPSLSHFVPGASPGLLAAEARRAATLLRQVRTDWFPPPASTDWPARFWVMCCVVLVLFGARDFWGVSRAVGILLGLPGGPGGAWWAGPPRAVDVIAYDLRLRVGSEASSPGDLVPWVGDISDVPVPDRGVVEVTGRLFGEVGALEMAVEPREGKPRRIPVPVDQDGRFIVRVRLDGEATWHLVAWAPPGQVVRETTRRRFRVAPPAPPSLEVRPSGWLAGGLGESVTVSWWASAPLALGAVEARYRYPWTEEIGPVSVSLRHPQEGGRQAQGVFPVVLGEDLLDRGGRMTLWVEATGILAKDQPSGRSEMIHLYLDLPLVRQLVLLERMDALIGRLVDLYGDIADLPGPGDPAVPGRWQGRIEDLVREVRTEVGRLGDQPAAAPLRTALEKVVGVLEEVLQEVPCRQSRVARALETTASLMDDVLARERIALLADQVAELDRLADRLRWPMRPDREWAFRLRTGRWQVGGIEAIRLSFLRRTPPEATGRRMALVALGANHRLLRERLVRAATGDREDVQRVLETVREVANQWRNLFAAGTLTHIRDILLPPTVREDLRRAVTLQERVAIQTGVVAARVRTRMEQQEAVAPDRLAEWRSRLEAVADLLRQSEDSQINPYDMEDLKALERQVRFLSDLLEAGDMDRSMNASRQVLGLLERLATTIRGDLAEGILGVDDRGLVAYRRVLNGIEKALGEMRVIQRALREVVSSRRDLLSSDDRLEVTGQVRIQRDAARVFGRVSDLLRRIPGIEGSEVLGLAQGIRAAMRDAADRLGRQDVLAAEAHQQKALDDLSRLRSLLSHRDLDSFRGREPARYWDDLRLPEMAPRRPVVQSWAAEVQKRLEQGLTGPDADLARAYYESLLSP